MCIIWGEKKMHLIFYSNFILWKWKQNPLFQKKQAWKIKHCDPSRLVDISRRQPTFARTCPVLSFFWHRNYRRRGGLWGPLDLPRSSDLVAHFSPCLLHSSHTGFLSPWTHLAKSCVHPYKPSSCLEWSISDGLLAHSFQFLLKWHLPGEAHNP